MSELKNEGVKAQDCMLANEVGSCASQPAKLTYLYESAIENDIHSLNVKEDGILAAHELLSP
ncbi:hypothetical protein MJO28_002196 [Puccinia striiformis f. sp. tritici]|uniref:Uncharacterized protein n=1 Tax=Puccinia striiformis f. sp. tritici TaxID=168172 RepID=A0ACC0EWG4_9BASI|nr:hypothetical protein MJO28_002196 [Puccinia striiformis f. sp. tritici]KAI7966527.1 hypothetical protein MJO29_002275 [Puccinia striiformis f. sp. tritici]